MSDKKQEREEKKKKEIVLEKRPYKAPILHGEELFERAVFAACYGGRGTGCSYPGTSSG